MFKLKSKDTVPQVRLWISKTTDEEELEKYDHNYRNFDTTKVDATPLITLIGTAEE